jgi:hypothetical protein
MDARKTAHGSVVRCCARVLDDLLIVARELRRPQFESELIELASEPERHLIVLVVHWRACIDAYIEGFVDGQEERSGMGSCVVSDFLVIHLQDARAALAESWPIIFEIEHDGVLARH